MKGYPGAGLPASTLLQWTALIASVAGTILAAFVTRPRKASPSVSVPASSGRMRLSFSSREPRRRRWGLWLIAATLVGVMALILPPFTAAQEPLEVPPMPPFLSEPPAPCGTPVAWGEEFAAAGVLRRPDHRNRVRVCVSAERGRTWESLTIGDGDDVFSRSDPLVFDGRLLVFGTVGTRAVDGQVHYDAAIWTCSARPHLRCPRVSDPDRALGGPQDQYITRATVSSGGTRIIAEGGTGRGGARHPAVWSYDGRRVVRRS